MYYCVNFHSLCTYGFRTKKFIYLSQACDLLLEAHRLTNISFIFFLQMKSQLTRLSGIFQLVVLHFIYRSGHC